MRLALALILTTLLALVSEGSAIQIWMAENYCDFHDLDYAKDEIVYVCGDWDEYDFPYPIGDIYITIDDGHVFQIGESLHDDMGSENAIQGYGGGGSFLDEIIALPELPLGRYDVVMDENQNGFFSGGAYPDLVLGNGTDWAFQVIDVTIGNDIDVSEIKGAAFENAAMWAAGGYLMRKGLSWGIDKIPDFNKFGIRCAYTGPPPQRNGVRGVDEIFHTVRENPILHDIAHEAIVSYLDHPPEPPEFEFSPNPMDYYRTYLLSGVYLLEKACFSQVEVYFDLYNDPPDPEFDQLISLQPIGYSSPLGPGEIHRRHLALCNALEEQAVLGVSLRQSIEKFQGAAVATNNYWAKIQNESIYESAEMFKTSVDDAITLVDDIQTWLVDTQGIGDAAHNGDSLAIFQDRIDSAGFTIGELDLMTAAGMMDAEIETLRVAILETDPYAFDGISIAASFDSLKIGMGQVSTALAGLITDAEAMRNRLSNVWIDHPTARINVPGSAPEGSPVVLSGSSSSDPQNGSLTYAWDLDADGFFDDDSGIQVTANWPGERILIIGLEVTDPTGLRDVAYARIGITEVNDGPFFTSANPGSTFVYLPGEPTLIPFAVTAEDPDSDPVLYEWFVNGETTGHAEPDFLWFPISGTNTVSVEISDESDLSLDNRFVWRIRADSSAVFVKPVENNQAPLASLGHCQPNPFWQTTEIELRLSEPADVRLVIFDSSGRLVRLLIENTIPAGRRGFLWDGRDNGGNPVASGVYYLQLEVGERKEARRVTLLR